MVYDHLIFVRWSSDNSSFDNCRYIIIIIIIITKLVATTETSGFVCMSKFGLNYNFGNTLVTASSFSDSIFGLLNKPADKKMSRIYVAHFPLEASPPTPITIRNLSLLSGCFHCLVSQTVRMNMCTCAVKSVL